MAKRSQAWKNLEKSISNQLNEAGIPAKRISRAANWSESTFDVEVEGHPEFKMDCKYSVAGFKTNRLLAETREKYCKEDGDVAIVFSKGYREQGEVAHMPAEFFFKLLKSYLKETDGSEKH